MKKKINIYLILFLSFIFLFPVSVSGADIDSNGTATDEKTTIRVAYYPLNDFFDYDEGGNECGYGVDYLNELSKYANINWQYVPVDNWDEIKEMILNGKVDICLPATKPAELSENLDYSVEPIMTTYRAIMTLKRHDDLYYKDYKSFAGLKIAIAENMTSKSGVVEYLDSIHVSDNLIYYSDYNQCYQALRDGKVDALVSNVMDLGHEMKILDKFSITDNYIMGLKNSLYMNKINSALTQLKLQNPSFQTSLYEAYFSERVIDPFTKEELDFIHNTDKLTIGVYSDRKPVSYYDEKEKQFKGMAIDMTEKLSEKTGIAFQYVPITTDNQLDMLKQVDLIMPVQKSDISDHYFLSNNILPTEVLMAIKKGEAEPEKGECIGVLNSTQGIAKVISNLNMFEIKYFDTNEQALAALQKGKITAFANSSHVINWILENPRYDNLTTLKYRSFPISYELCGNGDNLVLQSVLNKGIAAITTDESNSIVRRNCHYSMGDLTFSDKLYIYKNQFISFSIILFLVILTAWFYNYSRTKYIHQIEQSVREQENANKAKSDFLARMSHDMRTPLNVIMGMSQLAGDNKNPKDTDDCLNKINTASEFLLGLINDVLDMEHIESGKIELHYAPYSGSEFTQYIHAVISPLCEQKNIHFEYSYDGPSDFVILQDKLRINQVYFNILSNAVKFTPEGGKISFETKSEITAEQKVHMIVHISDNGIGMSQEFMTHMFDSFTQENQIVKPIGEGAGLGLTIVKRICDLMDMKISATSELGKGTTFEIEGEYEIVSPEKSKLCTDFKVDEEKSESDEVQNDIAGKIDWKNKIILVCEDHPLNQEIIQKLLEKKGAEVVMVDNGKRGVEAFSKSNAGLYDAILMDIRMPVMDGLTATETIRSMNRTDAPTVPIIALTANAYDSDVEKCLNAGMNAHLSKPLDINLLYSTLENFFRDQEKMKA